MDQVRLVVKKRVSFTKANYYLVPKIERAHSNNIILVFTDMETNSRKEIS